MCGTKGCEAHCHSSQTVKTALTITATWSLSKGDSRAVSRNLSCKDHAGHAFTFTKKSMCERELDRLFLKRE